MKEEPLQNLKNKYIGLRNRYKDLLKRDKEHVNRIKVLSSQITRGKINIDPSIEIDVAAEVKKYLELFYSVQLAAKCRRREYVIARTMFYHFMKKYTSKTLYQMGAYCGHPHHATIIHSLQLFEDLQIDRQFMKEYIRHEKYIDENIINPKRLAQ